MRSQGLPTSPSEFEQFYELPSEMTDGARDWMNVVARLSKPNKLVELDTLFHRPTPLGTKDSDIDDARRIVEKLADEVQQLHRVAALRKGARYPFNMANTRYLVDIRDANRLLLLQSLVDARDGNSEHVTRDFESALALVETLSPAPHMTAIVYRQGSHRSTLRQLLYLLPIARFSDAQLGKLSSSIANIRFWGTLERAFIGERAFCASLYANPDVWAPTDVRAMMLRFSRWRFHLDVINEMNYYIEAAKQPIPETLARLRQVASRTAQHDQQSSLMHGLRFSVSERMVEGWTRMFILSARLDSLVACSVVAMACERFRLASGEPPDRVNQLVPRYLERIPIDPCSGGPICYRREGMGFMVHSVGEDGVDDGGQDTDVVVRIGMSVPSVKFDSRGALRDARRNCTRQMRVGDVLHKCTLDASA